MIDKWKLLEALSDVCAFEATTPEQIQARFEINDIDPADAHDFIIERVRIYEDNEDDIALVAMEMLLTGVLVGRSQSSEIPVVNIE